MCRRVLFKGGNQGRVSEGGSLRGVFVSNFVARTIVRGYLSGVEDVRGVLEVLLRSAEGERGVVRCREDAGRLAEEQYRTVLAG